MFEDTVGGPKTEGVSPAEIRALFSNQFEAAHRGELRDRIWVAGLPIPIFFRRIVDVVVVYKRNREE